MGTVTLKDGTVYELPGISDAAKAEKELGFSIPDGAQFDPQAESASQSFATSPTGETSIRARTWRDTASEATRGLLRPLGLLGGAAVGAGIGPAGSLAGASLGYGIAEKGADAIDRSVLRIPEAQGATSLGQEFKQSANDVKTGAENYMMGEIAGAGLLRASNALRDSGAPERLIESVMKYPTTVKGQVRDTMVGTQFKHGIKPNAEGMQQVTESVSRLNAQAQALKDAATQNGVGAPTKDVAAVIDDVIDKWSISDQPQKYVTALTKYKDDLIQSNKPFLTVNELDQMKRNLQAILKPEFKQMISTNPTAKAEVVKQAQMSLEQSVRLKMEELVPGLREMNREQSDLLRMKPYLEQATNRIRNWNTVSLTDTIFGSAAGGAAYMTGGAAASPLVGIAAITVKKILTSPSTLTNIAMAVKKGLISPQTASALSASIKAAMLSIREDKRVAPSPNPFLSSPGGLLSPAQ